MTQEEKAKAYDRALEKAKIYRDNAKAVKEYAAVARYENIFPELHEEEKPLTPFQQCLSRILYKVYYASTPGSVDKFILGTIKRYTDELVELAKKHEYTDCQLHESEDERITRAINNMLPFIPDESYANNGVTKEGVLNWLEKQKVPKRAPDDLQKSFEAGQASIVDNPEQYGLCKKTEWSEEDKNGMFSDIIMAIRAFYKCGREDLVGYVKSLRPSFKPSIEIYDSYRG